MKYFGSILEFTRERNNDLMGLSGETRRGFHHRDAGYLRTCRSVFGFSLLGERGEGCYCHFSNGSRKADAKNEEQQA